MKQVGNTENLQTRREFFKRTTKRLLPILGLAILSQTPITVLSNDSLFEMGCKTGCQGGCRTLCEEGCSHSCNGGCKESCSRTCADDCGGHCNDTCKGTATTYSK